MRTMILDEAKNNASAILKLQQQLDNEGLSRRFNTAFSHLGAYDTVHFIIKNRAHPLYNKGESVLSDQQCYQAASKDFDAFVLLTATSNRITQRFSLSAMLHLLNQHMNEIAKSQKNKLNDIVNYIETQLLASTDLTLATLCACSASYLKQKRHPLFKDIAAALKVNYSSHQQIGNILQDKKNKAALLYNPDDTDDVDNYDNSDDFDDFINPYEAADYDLSEQLIFEFDEPELSTPTNSPAPMSLSSMSSTPSKTSSNSPTDECSGNATPVSMNSSRTMHKGTGASLWSPLSATPSPTQAMDPRRSSTPGSNPAPGLLREAPTLTQRPTYEAKAAEARGRAAILAKEEAEIRAWRRLAEISITPDEGLFEIELQAPLKKSTL